jgi:hypothetical protein
VDNCFDGPASRSLCRETCARRGKADGVARGDSSSLVVLAIEAGVLDTSTVGASPAAVDPSVAGNPPVAATVDASEGVAADVPGVAAVEGLTTAVGAWGAAVLVRLQTAAVDSDAAVGSGETIVAVG